MTQPQLQKETETAKPKVLFLDDHRLVLDALSFVASDQYDVRTVDSMEALEREVGSFAPHLIVLDVHLAEADGFEVARRLLSGGTPHKVMFLSMHTEPKYIRKATELGAQGYVSKRAPAEELMLAIRTVLNGGQYVGNRLQPLSAQESGAPLTDRQVEVLRLISQGLSAKEIAAQLKISVRTAEFHRAAIMERLKLHSTAMMTRYAVEHGII